MAEPVDYAWAAGIIDGEGCIRLARDHAPNGRLRHNLRVDVGSTTPEILTRLKEIFGVGSIHPHTKPRSPRHRPAWLWRVHTAQAEVILRAMLPYLVAKRNQAEAALLARSLVTRGPKANTNAARLAEIYDSMTEMKGRPR